METVTTSTNKEVEIDLLELFQVMLKHWKSLIQVKALFWFRYMESVLLMDLR